ncbi:hypothetical protein KSS87_017431 [Heliosperma pusillum]|nr:hypothetical protein KSS87_017431 [Heliosperma pusillum]
MNCRTVKQLIKAVIFAVILLKTEGLYVQTTYLRNAVAKGAVCLDGSAPAYNLNRGYGSGINSWLVQVEGGGWCNNITSCLARKYTHLGSSRKMDNPLAFSGIMSNNRMNNPDFYNWNRVKIRYCDGASFTGDVEAVDPALLSGCSAGGLTSILHCDSFRAHFPVGTKVKCLSDAGYFINVKDISGASHVGTYFHQIVKLHGSEKNLPATCTATMRPALCFFPQYVVPKIRTPIFILNAAYDSWQIKNILAPAAADPHGYWYDCKTSMQNCSTNQLEVMQDFRIEFLHALTGLNRTPSRGLFINSCYAHCQTELQETWFSNHSPVLHNMTIAESVGDWFYDRRRLQMIDCPYPCDRSCQNRIYEPQEPHHQV